MNIYKAISSNVWKTWIIMFLFVIFLTTIGFIYGQANNSGFAFAAIALVIATVTSLGSYFFADSVVLSSSGAKKITKHDNPDLYRIVENLAIGSGTPMPKLYIINDPSPNAFATGRDPKHASVAVTTGLLEQLKRVELEGVIAHELSHVKNYDIRLMAVVAILVGSVALMADFFLRSLWFRNNRDNRSGAVFLIIGLALAIITPLIATLIQLAVSRKRELLADASGVLLTRYPEGLAMALEKIAAYPKPVKAATNGTAHLYIENPFKGKKTTHWFSSLFNTHPSVEERIKILRSM